MADVEDARTTRAHAPGNRNVAWRYAGAVALGAAAAALGSWLQRLEESGAAHDGGFVHMLTHQLLVGPTIALLAAILLAGGSMPRWWRLAGTALLAWLVAVGVLALTA